MVGWVARTERGGVGLIGAFTSAATGGNFATTGRMVPTGADLPGLPTADVVGSGLLAAPLAFTG